MSKKMLLLVSSIMLITTLTILGLTVLKSEGAYTFGKAFADGETKIIVEDAPIDKGNYLAISDDKILIPVSILKEYIYKDVELSEQYNRLYVKMHGSKFKLETEELDKRVEEGTSFNFLVEKINNVSYINIRGLEKLFGITLSHLKERNLLIIDKIKEATEIGTIKENTYLRSGQSSFSPKLEELKNGDEVIVFAREGQWLKVRTSKGQLGYVLGDKADITIVKFNEVTSEDNNQVISPEKVGEIKSWTYLRGEKSSTGTRITRLEKGSILTILEEDEKWIKVKTDEGQEGYVLITKLEITIQEISILQEPNIIAKIKADTYLRSKKSSSSSSVVGVKDGEILDVLENDGKWVKAKTSKGKEGYILLSKVEITKKEGNEAQEFTKVGEIKSWTYLRAKKSSGSTRIARLEKEDELLILEEDDRWLKVTTDKGQEGYVLASKVIITLQPNSGDKQGNSISQKLNTVREDWKVNGKINMVWDHIGKYSPDLSKEEKIEGLDVISPTWFTITNASGTVVNNGDFKYSQDAHSKGYKENILLKGLS